LRMAASTVASRWSLASANPQREGLPVAGNGERPVPDARRTVARSTEG
jgi:hypothetical protein